MYSDCWQKCVELTTHLIDNIHESELWPKKFAEVAVIAFKENQKLQSAATIAQSASSHMQQR
jgi:hypothetical protein